MCSSPRSSGGTVPKIRVKGFLEEMAPLQRRRFTEVANRADERRAKRDLTNKRWKAKHTTQTPSSGLFYWFGKIMGLNQEKT